MRGHVRWQAHCGARSPRVTYPDVAAGRLHISGGGVAQVPKNCLLFYVLKRYVDKLAGATFTLFAFRIFKHFYVSMTQRASLGIFMAWTLIWAFVVVVFCTELCNSLRWALMVTLKCIIRKVITLQSH